MSKLTCQEIIVVLNVLSFLWNLMRAVSKKDVTERVSCMIVTFVLFPLLILLYWKAGTYSELFGP